MGNIKDETEAIVDSPPQTAFDIETQTVTFDQTNETSCEQATQTVSELGTQTDTPDILLEVNKAVCLEVNKEVCLEVTPKEAADKTVNFDNQGSQTVLDVETQTIIAVSDQTVQTICEFGTQTVSELGTQTEAPFVLPEVNSIDSERCIEISCEDDVNKKVTHNEYSSQTACDIETQTVDQKSQTICELGTQTVCEQSSQTSATRQESDNFSHIEPGDKIKSASENNCQTNGFVDEQTTQTICEMGTQTASEAPVTIYDISNTSLGQNYNLRYISDASGFFTDASIPTVETFEKVHETDTKKTLQNIFDEEQ